MIDFEYRLNKLKYRRQSPDQIFTRSAYASPKFESIYREEYETLSESDSIKYITGAMSAVSKRYKSVSIQEGERVANTLIDMLLKNNIHVTKKMQGSVALDIHIEASSDVDMLIIEKEFFTFDPSLAYPLSTEQRPMLEILADLRKHSEDKLTSQYHKAKVDCMGGKSIALSEGSLQRKVDIVPSCWHHTKEFYYSNEEHDKEILVYDKNNHKLISNKPFLHIKRVNEQDRYYSGNLKKVIRLMKNVIAEMSEQERKLVKKLSSYDLTSLGYHMGDNLHCPSDKPLILLKNLENYLSIVASSELYRNTMEVPDGSRYIFNTQDKTRALDILCKEISNLTDSVFQVTEFTPQ